MAKPTKTTKAARAAAETPSKGRRKPKTSTKTRKAGHNAASATEVAELYEDTASRDEPRRRAGWVRAGAWVGFVGAYAAAQAISMHFSGDAAKQTRKLDTPSFNPPTIVFPIVWTGLNVLTGTSAWLVWDRGTPGDPARRNALVAWGAAIVARTGYNPLAFGLKKRWLATADAGVLAATMGTYTGFASSVERLAGLLALPETAWTSFATILSADIARRNA